MELKIAVAELSKALQRVQGIVEKKTTMPILANVLLETRGTDGLTVSATNLEVGLTGTYPAQVASEGSITLAGRSLYDIVKSLPGETLVFKRTANNWVEITSGKVNYKVVGVAADGFPTLPKFEDVACVPIDAATFREMIRKTIYSVSTDETRFNLTGVYCEPLAQGPGLRMVSTDGHRLSMIDRPMEKAPPMKKGVLIPRKGLIELRKLLEDGDRPGQLGFVENSAVFEKDGLTLTMQLLEGQFPDYQQVIPNASPRKVRVAKDLFHAALRRTSLLSPDKAQGVRIDLQPGLLALSANNPDLGEAREELEVEYAGETLKVGFNFKYLLDVLEVLDEARVEFELTDALSPGVLRGVGAEDYRAIIMPMRI